MTSNAAYSPYPASSPTEPMSSTRSRSRPHPLKGIHNLTFGVRERLRLFCNVALVKEVSCLLMAGLCAGWLWLTWGWVAWGWWGDVVLVVLYMMELLLRYAEWGVRGVPAVDMSLVALACIVLATPLPWRKLVLPALSLRYLYNSLHFAIQDNGDYFQESEPLVDLEHTPSATTAIAAFASPQSGVYGTMAADFASGARTGCVHSVALGNERGNRDEGLRTQGVFVASPA